jgi:hypothetical protein
VPPCEQEFGEVAADAAHGAGCSSDEDRGAIFRFVDLGLRSKDEPVGGAPLERTAAGTPRAAFARLVCFASTAPESGFQER